MPHRARRRKTLTPRFTDFEKKSDCFAVYNYHEISFHPTPTKGFVNALLEWRVSLAWVSGVSGENGKDGSEKGRAEGEKRLTQMLLLEPSTPTQHDSICWMVLFQTFLSLLLLPASPSKISSPPSPLGRPDTQASVSHVGLLSNTYDRQIYCTCVRCSTSIWLRNSWNVL